MYPPFDPCDYLDYSPDTGVLRWRQGKRNAGKEAGCVSTTMQGCKYRLVKIQQKQIYAHRLIWRIMTGCWPDHDVDHKNRDSLDNRWCNLRSATKAQNGQNRSLDKRSTTGVSGVSFHKGCGKYRVLVQANGKRHFFGWFDQFEDAVSVATAERARLCGDFAPTL